MFIESTLKNHVSNKLNYIDTCRLHVYKLNTRRHITTRGYANDKVNHFFSVSLEYFYQIAKKKRQLVGYICHGFENDDTGLVHLQ